MTGMAIQSDKSSGSSGIRRNRPEANGRRVEMVGSRGSVKTRAYEYSIPRDGATPADAAQKAEAPEFEQMQRLTATA